jgi:hypothetical protein
LVGNPERQSLIDTAGFAGFLRAADATLEEGSFAH